MLWLLPLAFYFKVYLYGVRIGNWSNLTFMDRLALKVGTVPTRASCHSRLPGMVISPLPWVLLGSLSVEARCLSLRLRGISLRGAVGLQTLVQVPEWGCYYGSLLQHEELSITGEFFMAVTGIYVSSSGRVLTHVAYPLLFSLSLSAVSVVVRKSFIMG